MIERKRAKFHSKIQRGVYCCCNEQGEIIYVGSTDCNIERLEYNHRNWQTLNYGPSHFRYAIIKYGQKWKFKWLVERAERNQIEIEILERDFIKKHNPQYNVDKDPVASSIKYGRYTLEEAEKWDTSTD